MQFVLTDMRIYRLMDNEKCAFTVDQKNVLSKREMGMNVDCTNAGGWYECNMRRWIDSAYTNALLEGYESVFKNFVVEGDIVDRFSIRSEMELFGRNAYGEDDFGYQIKYYEKTRNRLKLKGSDTARAEWYWARSARKGFNDSFCAVNENGDPCGNTANCACGIAVFGCI